MFTSQLRIVVLLALSAFLILGDANAAAFLKLGDIKGEATDKDHKEWIDVLSVSQGVHRPGSGATGQSRRRGGANFDDISIAKSIDASSPKLMLACAQGQVIPEVMLDLTRGGGKSEPYLTYKLKNVMITSYSVNADGESGNETFTLSYEEIEVTYSKANSDGRKGSKVEAKWNVRENRQ